MSLQRACDVCHSYKQRFDGSPAVLRYTLRRDLRSRARPRDGFQATLGSIDLCDTCWEHIAKPRMSPARSRAAKAAHEARKAAAA